MRWGVKVNSLCHVMPIRPFADFMALPLLFFIPFLFLFLTFSSNLLGLFLTFNFQAI